MVGNVMTIAPQSLAGLSLAEKRELLAQLLQEKSERSAAVFPLSHGQRGLWFLHQMDPRELGVQRLLSVADPVAARPAGLPPCRAEAGRSPPRPADDVRRARRRALRSASTSSLPCRSR